MFDFSGVKDNGHNMNSQESRSKMHLLVDSTATFHEKLKLGESLHQGLCHQLAPSATHGNCCISDPALIILKGACKYDICLQAACTQL